MRRLLRDVAEERALGDVTTLADPAIVEQINWPVGLQIEQQRAVAAVFASQSHVVNA